MGTRRAAAAAGIFPALGAGAGFGHKSELAQPQMRRMPGPSLFSRAVGLPQEKRECSRVFLEARGFGTEPALLWLRAKAASQGSKGAVEEELKPEKDGMRLVHPGKEKVSLLPVCT